MKYRIRHAQPTDDSDLDVVNAWEPTDADLDTLEELKHTMLDVCEAALDAKFIELRDEALSEISAVERNALLALSDAAQETAQDNSESPLSAAEMDQFGRTLIKEYQKAMVADLVGPLVEAARLATNESNEPFVRLDETLIPYETRFGPWLEEEISQIGLRYDLPIARLKQFAALFARRAVSDATPKRFPGGTVLAQSPRSTFGIPLYRATTEAKWREAVRQNAEIESGYGKLQEFYASWFERLRQTAVAHNTARIDVKSSLEPVEQDLRPQGDIADTMAHVRSVSNFLFAGAMDEAEQHRTYAPYEGVVLGFADNAESYYLEFSHNCPVRSGSIKRDFAQAVEQSSKVLKTEG